MVQEISDKLWQAEARTGETKQFIRDIKRITRRSFTAEEKIRIVLEGIRPATYYAWLKDFMEAGKERLQRDAVRDVTMAEIQELRRDNARLKQLVAELSLQVHVLKKTAIPGLE